MPVLGELRLRDSLVQLVRIDNRNKRFDGLYSESRHLLHLDIDHDPAAVALSPRLGRYADGHDLAFAGIGPVMFRPAGFRVEARGLAPSYRLQCWLAGDSLDAFREQRGGWSSDSLARTLDIRARNLGLYMARLANEVANPGFAAGMTADAVLTLVLGEIADYIDRRPPVAPGAGPADRAAATETALKLVVERICDLADLTPTIDELALLAGVAKPRLLRLFREACGMSLVAFVKDMRLQRARHYLAFTDMSLTQIAERLCFSSQANFATAFRREMGVAPREYRREHRTRMVYARTARASLA